MKVVSPYSPLTLSLKGEGLRLDGWASGSHTPQVLLGWTFPEQVGTFKTDPTLMLTLSGLRSAKRCIVIGIGGGADIVGTIPTLDLLDLWGVEWIAGGLSWERIVYDPLPGPRRVEELLDARPVAPGIVLAGPGTRTADGVTFAEAGFAAACRRDTLLLDIHGGVQGVVRALSAAAEVLQADAIIGVDVGGDSLAVGGEPGLRSPLCDSIMVAALAGLAQRGPCLLGLLGYGCDGELSQGELDEQVATIATHGGYLGAWGITPNALRLLDRVLETVKTEASLVPAKAAHGVLTTTTIRDERTVRINPVTTVTFFLDPEVVFHHVAPLARQVKESASLDEANEALHDLGLRTELDRERWMAAQGIRDYSREQEFRAASR